MRFVVRTLGLWIVAAAIAVSVVACRSDQPAASTATEQTQPAAPPAAVPDASALPAIQFTPPPPAYTGELPPLPTSPYPAPRPPEVIRAVYTFAARHPEVLHYVPCFCGCQDSGHQDNDDCFIQSRDASGRPTWDAHGMT